MSIDLDYLLKFAKEFNILYVEDDEEVSLVFRETLNIFFNKVYFAVNGLDGLEKFENNSIDLILTDITMPLMNGLDMSKEIKKINQDIPIIITSAHDDIEYFVQMLKLIKEKLDSEEINYEYLDGSTKNRMEVVNKFNESEDKKVFLLSLKAGGTGLNLTSADIVIHVDPWWNPQIERQATDRAHRMGQNKKVMVYKLITKGTVEEKMLKLQDRKKEVFDAVIDSNSGSLSKVTWNDIQELLSVK